MSYIYDGPCESSTYPYGKDFRETQFIRHDKGLYDYVYIIYP